MKPAPRPDNEEARLHALRTLRVLDTPTPPNLDRITRTAARLFDVPIALVSLIDAERQWFKSCAGLDLDGTSREVAFCAHAILGDRAMVVTDACEDERFRDNPLVTGPPHARFYAGFPVRSPDGYALGTLCLIDNRPREFSDADRAALEDLALLAEQVLHGQRAAHDARMARTEQARDGDLFARIVAEAAVGIAVVSPDGRWLEVNQPLCDLAGRSREQMLGTRVRDILHPDDADVMVARARQVRSGHASVSGEELRFVHGDGSMAWAQVGVSALHDPDGKARNLIVVVTDIRARKQAELELGALKNELEARVEARTRDLEEEKEHFRHTLKTATDAFIETDAEGRVLIWNNSAERIFGHARDAMVGQSLVDSIVPSPLREPYRRLFHRIVASGGRHATGRQLELRGMRSNGQEFPLEATLGVLNMGGRVLFNAFLRDISHRKAAEAALRQGETRLRTITDNLPVMIARIGADLRYQFHNRYYHKCFTLPANGLIGRHVREFWGEATYQTLRPVIRRVLAGERQDVEYSLPGRDQPIWLHSSLIPAVESDGRTQGFYLLARDITEERRLRKQLQHEALHDPLTGLPNRRALLGRIDEAMARSNRSGHAMGLLFMDLDAFKTINDTLGHDFGDAVLQTFADVIRDAVRETDLVARIAGDEFVVVLERLTHPQENVGHVAWAILERLKEVHEIQGVAMSLSSSIGAAVHRPSDEETAQELLTRADAAMYRAKARGKDRFSL